MKEDDIQSEESLQQVNRQDWRDGLGGDDSSPDNTNPPTPLPPPTEEIPTLSEEDSLKLEEWRNSKEFQIGLEKIKSESVQDTSEETTFSSLQLLTEPPEKIKRIAKNLQKAFKGFNIYILWDETYEKQVHSALGSISSKEEFDQVLEYYNKHFAQNENIPSLKEDLYQELKDTPKDFLKALAVYNGFLEEEPTTTDVNNGSSNSDVEETKIGGMLEEVVIYASPPPTVNLGSDQEIDIDASIKRILSKNQDGNWECDVFIESPSGKAESTTVNKTNLKYKYKSKEVGTHKVYFAYKENSLKEVEIYEASFKVLSQQDYLNQAMEGTSEPLAYGKLQQQITFQEFLASNQATDDSLLRGQDFYISSDKPNPLNVEEDYQNSTATLGYNKVNFKINDSDQSSVVQYKWYMQMTPEKGVTFNRNIEDVGENTRFEMKGDFGSQTIVGENIGMSDKHYYIVCEALDEHGEIVKTASYRHVEMTTPTYKRYEAVKKYNQSVDQEEADLRANISGFNTNQLLPVKAVHVTQSNGAVTTANIYILPIETDEGTQYKMLDFSPNPAASKRRDYKTSDSVAKALQDFTKRNHYPKGTLKLELPQEILPEQMSKEYLISTKGKSDMKAVSDGLAVGSLIMGVIGAVMLLTPAAPAGLIFLGGSAVTGVAAGSTGFAAELDTEKPSGTILALEGISVVSNLLGLKTGFLSVLGKPSAKWLTWTVNFLDNVEVIYFSTATAKQIDAILSDPNLTDEQRQKALMQCLQNAAIMGGMYALGKMASAKNGKGNLLDDTYPSAKEVDAFYDALKKKVDFRKDFFTLRYTKEDLEYILKKTQHLGLDDETIVNFLYIGSRTKKYQTPDTLIGQMTIYGADVAIRKYPYKFSSFREFEDFSKVLKAKIAAFDVPVHSVIVQGSSVRKKNPGDLDLAVMTTESEFNDLIVRAFNGKVTLDGKNIDTTGYNSNQLLDLAKKIDLRNKNNPIPESDIAMKFRYAIFDRKIITNVEDGILPGMARLKQDLTNEYQGTYEKVSLHIFSKDSHFNITPYLDLP